jgi:hypothetical protein
MKQQRHRKKTTIANVAIHTTKMTNETVTMATPSVMDPYIVTIEFGGKSFRVSTLLLSMMANGRPVLVMSSVMVGLVSYVSIPIYPTDLAYTVISSIHSSLYGNMSIYRLLGGGI